MDEGVDLERSFKSEQEIDAYFMVSNEGSITPRQLTKLKKDMYICSRCLNVVLLSHARGGTKLGSFTWWDADLTYSDRWVDHSCAQPQAPNGMSWVFTEAVLATEFERYWGRYGRTDRTRYYVPGDVVSNRRAAWVDKCKTCPRRVLFLGGENPPPPFEVPGPGHNPDHDRLVIHDCRGWPAPVKKPTKKKRKRVVQLFLGKEPNEMTHSARARRS